MNLAKIHEEVAKLTSAEREELSAHLAALKKLDDPGFMERLTRARDESEQGVGVMTRDEMLRRLRAAGHDV